MKIDIKLDELKKIRRVDAPPFLFTRIRQEIQNSANAQAPEKWKWAFAATAVMILALNLSLILKSNTSDHESGINNVVNAMSLSSSNELYHE